MGRKISRHILKVGTIQTKHPLTTEAQQILHENTSETDKQPMTFYICLYQLNSYYWHELHQFTV